MSGGGNEAMADRVDAPSRRELFIAGRERPPSGGAYAPITDPSTLEPLGEVAVATADDARAAVEAAAAVEERWGSTPGHERARLLRTVADRLAQDRASLARTIAREVGKPIRDARGEVDRAVGVFRFAAEEIRHLTGESFPADAFERPAGNEHRFLFTVRDPIGVVVAIGPFNFPLNLLAHKVAPALAAGNPVVVKPTSAAPLTAYRLADHLAAAGFPAGTVNVVSGPGGAVGDALVEHPSTRLVTFTGSTDVGRHIAERAARHAHRVILEMGGLDPFVVLDDASVEPTAAAAALGAFSYSGQVCTASKRLLVQDGIADRFARALAERAGRLTVGPALDESTDVGPLIDGRAVERIDAMVREARARSAELLVGGDRPSGRRTGHFYLPTVLDRVDPASTVVREEPFGPIAPIVRFRDEDEAAAIANGTPYGLQAAVYTRDLSRAFRFAKRLRAGGVHINDPTTLRWDALPFGGIKASGVGREGLRYAMEEMTEVKLISVNYAT